jgi:hypothetical protein
LLEYLTTRTSIWKHFAFYPQFFRDITKQQSSICLFRKWDRIYGLPGISSVLVMPNVPLSSFKPMSFYTFQSWASVPVEMGHIRPQRTDRDVGLWEQCFFLESRWMGFQSHQLEGNTNIKPLYDRQNFLTWHN